MEAIVFGSTPRSATRIRSVDDLESEFVMEPLVVSSARVFGALATAAGLSGEAALKPLRDATCQSFPVWTMARALSELISRLDSEEVDELVERWRDHLGPEEIDADLYELSVWLLEWQDAFEECEGSDERLFVLFEEKAMP